MSARSLGRGVCPKCGEEGSVVVKWVGGKEYVYVKHGRTWHYIGPVDKVDIYALLREPTTALPLRAGREVGIAGGSMSGQPRALSKDVVAVVGILLVALGSLIAIGVVA
uniref:Uncharacterized protein n=1 Tax=Thermofilum pendens TaxID=2269 RepID=A0A7C3WSU0_THEPE